ncbi:sensor histidine kinase [Streptomyces cinnamoneus]|uniref:sensor histidine kinase n=1 Tax=Streptomyces cinnamoneus TaxID=53446 RepID=UPI001EFE9B33|nr:histidine kinase [Streptomyces cinnamoneus]
MGTIKNFGRREAIPAVAAALTGCAAVGAVAVTRGGVTQPYGALSAIAAATVLLWVLAGWPRSTERLGGPLALAGVLSLAVTVGAEPPTTTGESWVRLVEVAVLLVLLVVAARWVPPPRAVAAGAPAATAVATWSLPLMPAPSVLTLAGAAAFWSLPVLGAVVVGGYPRLMEHRRRRLVVETRRSQQLELARDLHDFVAHDVSGIVAQAQAARFVAETDPARALPALERIEAAGLNALASMDRMVKTLHEADGADARPVGTGGVEPLPGVDQLPGLVARFSSADLSQTARLGVAAGATDGLSRTAGSTAYRTVVEALTNVRRHAPGASRVDVALTRVRTTDGASALEVSVVDDGGAGKRAGTRTALRREREGHGGRGLNGLRERVRAAGGTLVYGPHGDGWRVTAVLPLTPEPLSQEPPTPEPPAPEPLPSGPKRTTSPALTEQPS